MARKYKCPYCDFKDESPKLIRHIERKHEELIPEGYTPARLVYNIRNKREFGSCMICKKRTEWDESTGRYKPFCSQACHDKYVKRFEDNMIRVRGKARILDDPQQQEKMLANRKISGKYKFRDGGERTYTGSYEHKALEFLDKVMNVDSKDIMTPGPTLQYEYGGKTHTWITDIYWISLNLIIEVKDGGNNPNNREMKSYREKQIAKEKMITDKGTFHYLRLTNNNFEQLFNIAAEIKMSSMEDENDTIIRINESTIDEVGPVGGMPPKITHSGYLIDKGFNGIDPTKDDDNYYSDEKDEDGVVEESVLANDIISDKVVRLNEDGIPESVDKSYLDGSKITIYKFLGDKKRFLEVASSKKPVNDFYEALTGKKRLTENQIEYDPMFERVNLRKEYNRIAEDLVTMEQEMMLRSNKALPYLPVMNIKDMESAEKILKKYKSLNIAEDVNGYFLYNRFTGRRGMSVRDINKLIVEDTCLLEESKDKSEDTDEKLADREANDYMSSSINAFIDDNVKTKAELDQEYNDYMSMTQDDRKRADDKSIELYGKDNIERYEEKNREFLKQDIKPNTTGEYDGVRSEASSDLGIFEEKDATYLDFDKFESGKVRVLYITGMSGGGKTTLAKKLAKKYNAVLVSLDDFLTNYDPIQSEYFKANPEDLVALTKLSKGAKHIWEIKDREFWSFFNELRVKYVLFYLNKYKNKKFIIEGVQVVYLYDYEVSTNNFKLFEKDSFALIMLGTPVVKSMLRRIKRDGTSITDVYNPLSFLWMYRNFYKEQNRFRNAFIKEASMSAEDALNYANFPFMQDMFEEKIKPSAKMKKEDWENFKFGNTDRCLMYSMDDSSRVNKLISGANKYLKIGSKSKKCDCPYKVSCERNDGKANIYLVKEATYNFEYVKYGQDEIDRAKVWSANAMRVIITPTKTLEDLEFLWNQFQQQHRKLQRESDWKSQELFGMDNQTHYIYLKRKFVKKDIDDDPVEHYDGTDDSILDEVYMEKGTDLSRNLDLFTHGNTKVLFITGITGSGKSTLARQLAKVCNAKLVSLDSLEKYKNLKEANYIFPDMVENYMNKYGDRIDLCKYIVENANEKYIIEGVQVVDVFLRYPDIFDKSALILKQTPLKEAVVRKFKRDICNLNLLESLKDAYTSYLDIKEFKKKLSKNILVPMHTNNLQSIIFEEGEVYSDLPMYTPTTIGNLLSYYGYEGDKMPAWAVEYDRCASKGVFSDKFWELNKERMENLKKVFKTTKENSLSRNIECIHWGWNPNVEFNDKNRAKNDRKMSKWFREESRKGYVEEKAFPLQFDKDGDLIYTKDPGEIDYAKEWKKSHDLLKEYDKMKNIESMKYELCRMWLIANNLEYYKGTKFGDMKRMRDTRALALNDFKKYIKVVMKYDKSFNFGQYYEASPFNQNTLRIHKSTLDYSMEYIKKLIGII